MYTKVRSYHCDQFSLKIRSHCMFPRGEKGNRLLGTSRNCYRQKQTWWSSLPACELEFVSDFVRIFFVTPQLCMVLNSPEKRTAVEIMKKANALYLRG